MTTNRHFGINVQESGCRSKESKTMVYISKAAISEDKNVPKFKPPITTIKDRVQIINKTNVKPPISTANEAIILNKSCSRVNETKTFIEKKKKERTEKSKLDLLEKKKFAEERKKKLEQLKKTTRELAKASIKQKKIRVGDECKIVTNLTTKKNQPEVDLTWSPPPKVKNCKKTLKRPTYLQKKLKDPETTNNGDNVLDTTKNVKSTTPISPRTTKYANTSPQTKLIEKIPNERCVTKPENLFSKLNFNDDFQLFDNNIFDVPTTDNILLQQKDNNDNNDVKLTEEIWHNNEKPQEKDSSSLNKDVFDVNLYKKSIGTKTIDTQTYSDLHLPNKSHEEIMKSIDHLVQLQDLMFDQCLSSKKSHSESTQTDDCNNSLSLFSSKKVPPPMNFISVLKCKQSLQQIEQNKPVTNLSMNEYSIKNNQYANKNNSEDTVKSAVVSVPNKFDKIEHLSNLSHNKQTNSLNNCKSSLFNETILQEPNSLSKQITENTVCETKTKITNEGVKEVLQKLNYDFDFLTKSSCYNSNDLHNTCIHLKFGENCSINESPCFPQIHSEFQAELETLDQLNNSLCVIEKMSSDASIQTNEQSINNKVNCHHTSNNLDLTTVFNAYSNNKTQPFSNLNVLSSNMTSVDKTITGFSIQMFEQLIKDEELRAKQHHTILRLREKSLINRLKWEVTMCDLQVKNLKNRPGHEKQLQLLKQKQRGSVKKLEHSLSQVKRLGRVIDSVYKQRLIMLEEHLQYLRVQSSSKKVIRKLKSLDPIPRKEDNACQSFSSHFYKKCDMIDFIDAAESEPGSMNYVESHSASKSTSPTMYKLNKSKTNLQIDQTTSSKIETKLFNQSENVKDQTINVEWTLQCPINKSIQTSRTLFNSINKEDIKSSASNNLIYNNKSFDANIINDKTQLSSILPTYPIKPRQHPREFSNSSNSDQSDMDVRITTLQEQLEARKLESLRLKKEQKKLRLENLKAKEQDLLNQIELYDRKIEESKKSLMVEVERRNIQVIKSSVKPNFSSGNSSCSVLQNIINCDNYYTIEKHNENLNASNKITDTNEKKNFCELPTKMSNKLCLISTDKPLHKLQHSNVFKLNANLESVNIDDCKVKNESLESNHVCEVAPLHNNPATIEINFFEQRFQSEDKVIHVPNNVEENLIKETFVQKTNKDRGINLKVPLCENSISNKNMLNISKNQELYLEKNMNTEKSIISFDSINYSHSNTSSSNSSNIRKNMFINLNKNDYDACVKNQNSDSKLNNDIEIHDDYSPDFTSDESTSEYHGSYDFSKHQDDIIELSNCEQNNESSHEEERSEGDVIFEDNTIVEQCPDCKDLVKSEKSVNDNVDAITNRIFNCLLKDTKKTLKSNMNKPLFFSEKIDLNNLTEETPLLMNLKRDKENQNMIFLSEQATTISDVLLKRHLLPLISETLQLYLPKLNEIEKEKLIQYINWSSKRKKLKLSEYFNFQHKTSDVDNDESFEIFYQNYQDQKNCQTCKDESSIVILQSQQEAEKLKLEQLRIEEEIERLRMTEEPQLFLREIPNKPPPPYKSPTKKKALVDMPYTSDEIQNIVFAASSQLFNGSQNSFSKDYITDSEDLSLHADYKTLIFDYCKEIAQDIFTEEKNLPKWKKSVKPLKQFRPRPKSPKDLSDMVIKNLNHIVEIDECEEKVNKFVVKQMHEEDSKWTDFQMDELDIQNDIVQHLMKELFRDTLTSIKTNFYLKFV